jgi:hypothetical protein
MTSATLKLLACALMVVDHLGSIFFPHEPVMRAIGRLAYPMFAYLIAEGYSHSKDKTSYLGRLFLLSLVSHPSTCSPSAIPWSISMSSSPLPAALRDICLREEEELRARSSRRYILEFVKASYGLPGALMIFVMHYFMGNHRKMFLWVLITAVLCTLRGIVWRYFDDPNFMPTLAWSCPTPGSRSWSPWPPSPFPLSPSTTGNWDRR